MALYIVLITILLSQSGLWEIKNLSTTLKWSLIVAFVMLFKFEKAKEPDYFKNSFKDNLKILIIVEFIVNLYVFNLWGEILFFPFIVILSTLLAFSETDNQYDSVKKILNGFMVIIGSSLLIYAVYKTITDFSKFATLKNLQDFYLPILYSLSFIPFIYLIALYSNYETFFIRLGFFVEQSSVLRYAKFRTIFATNLSIKNLNSWSQYVNSNWRFKSKQEVDDAILVFTKSLKREKKQT